MWRREKSRLPKVILTQNRLSHWKESALMNSSRHQRIESIAVLSAQPSWGVLIKNTDSKVLSLVSLIQQVRAWARTSTVQISVSGNSDALLDLGEAGLACVSTLILCLCFIHFCFWVYYSFHLPFTWQFVPFLGYLGRNLIPSFSSFSLLETITHNIFSSKYQHGSIP